MYENELIRSPTFSRVPADTIHAATVYFSRRVLPAGALLWHEDDAADALAVVVSGRLQVRAGVQDVGEVGPGELLGEASVFMDERRSASVQAVEESVIWELTREHLAQMATALPEVYDRLLEQALQEMARRVRAVDLKIARIADGTDAAPPAPVPVSGFLKALRSLRKVTVEDDAPVWPVLRALPGLGDADPAIILAIGRAMKPRKVEAEVAVFLEGDGGDSAFVIAEGDARVLRNVRGGRARRLATLGRGSLFGTGSLLLGERRNASVVTSTSPTRMFELDRAAMASLTGPAGRAWRFALLHALRQQVVGASNHLAELKGGTSPEDRERLRRAAEQAVAWTEADDPWIVAGRVR